MSQFKESDDNLAIYYSAIGSFESASLFNNEQIDFTQIHHKLHTCYKNVETLISVEGSNTPYFVHIFQLKNHFLELMKIMERNIMKQVTPLAIPINRMQQIKKTPDDNDKAQSCVKITIEIPRVSSFKEIAGLWEVKKIIKSLIILPQVQPQLFCNRKVCNSVLLFGPPGTGKTRLVHAMACEANATLHCASVSILLSPLVGQTEKNVRALFEHVRNGENFSILFIDEVDGFCRTRHDSEQDHTRRLKTELMCQMSKIEGVKNMFLICATNCPWDLDTAFLRRFQKRIYIPLPSTTERQELFHLFTRDTPLEVHSEHWEQAIKKTEGFSGSDLSDLVQTALDVPITELEDTKIWKTAVDGIYEPVLTAEDFDMEDIICCELDDLPYRSVRARPVNMLDVLNVVEGASATVSHSDVKRYETFINKK